MDRQFYTVLLLPDLDRGAYTVTVPLLPGCITEGDSLGEALTHAREAITLFVATLRAGGEEVPREPAPATVLSAAIAEAEETMRFLVEDLRERGKLVPTEIPAPLVATVDVGAVVAA